MTSTVSAATEVFYTPSLHSFVRIWNGERLVTFDTGGELSQLTTDTTKTPAAVAANSSSDLFVWDDDGTIRCARGPAWTSATARSSGAGTTELARVHGVLMNAQAIANGPAATRGTYVGTIRSNATSTLDWVVRTPAAGGQESRLHVWNVYNQRAVKTWVKDTTTSWTSTTGAFQPANVGLGGGLGNRVSVVRGLSDDDVRVYYRLAAGTYQWRCGYVGQWPKR